MTETRINAIAVGHAFAVRTDADGKVQRMARVAITVSQTGVLLLSSAGARMIADQLIAWADFAEGQNESLVAGPLRFDPVESVWRGAEEPKGET